MKTAKNYLASQMRETITARVRKKQGLGRIFNHLRKMKCYAHFSDLALFRSVLSIMADLRNLPPRNKINYHFRKKISKDDYAQESKGEILRDLHLPTR